ncbi:hypothetical protein GCM10023339_20980 [Alloalcanivorax gelatiniphagus]
MGGFRAKDEDRDRYVDILEAAYVDGQLGHHDRELRVSRALVAETLDELDALTRDLQNRPAPVVLRDPPALAPAPPPPAPPVEAVEPLPWLVTPRRTTPAWVVGGLAAGMLALVAFTMSSVDPSRPDLGYSVPWDEIDSASVPGYEMTERDVLRFVRRYEARFDTTEVHEVRILPDRVVVHVPARGSVASRQSSWDGEWRREAAPQPLPETSGTLSLLTLDVTALFVNIDVAVSDLGVVGAEVHRVVVRPSSDGTGSVTIHVGNGSGDRALLETTAQGSRVRAVPHHRG